MTEIELPTPAWTLKEIITNAGTTFVIYQYATFRTNEELIIHRMVPRGPGTVEYRAQLTGSEGKDVSHRLTQERWADIYAKAIAGQALLGRKPDIVEEIF